MMPSREMGSFRTRIINFVFQIVFITDLGEEKVTELLPFLLLLLLIPCTRSHAATQATDSTPLWSGISVGGQRWGAVQGNSLQQFNFRGPSAHLTLHSFSPLSCAKYKLLHVTFHLRGTNLRHKDGNFLKLKLSVIQQLILSCTV